MKTAKLALMCGFAAVLLVFSVMTAMAQTYQGAPPKSGKAAFKFGDRDLAYANVEGGFQQVSGVTMATLIFKPEVKIKDSHLNLTLMYQGPGRVDLDGAFSMSGIGLWWSGGISNFTKGKSKCTITLTKATPTEVEGIAECPSMHDADGKPAQPLTNVRFSATAK